MIEQSDLRNEAVSLKKFAKNFENESLIQFPRIYEEFVSQDVLIESFEQGEEISRFFEIDSSLRKSIALTGIKAFFKMLFEDNFFHSDLHPGNILVRKQGNRYVITLLDCGLARSFSRNQLNNFQDVFLSICSIKNENVGKLLIERSPYEDCKQPEIFCKEIKDLISSVDLFRLKFTSVSKIISDLVYICKTHKVMLDGNFVSVIMAVLVLEGIGKSLDNELSVLKILTEYLYKQSKKKTKSFFIKKIKEVFE